MAIYNKEKNQSAVGLSDVFMQNLKLISQCIRQCKIDINNEFLLIYIKASILNSIYFR
ncbi:unnamed protein product [Paramecium sonneborni]|uniref:Uncharacterized protein n=1 Tax=Paramecium sonneborni TaxID=65129 RepID=A0A8S1L3E5_9CILI|nr:unnamed protein product [Paramecium sonneborni]